VQEAIMLRILKRGATLCDGVTRRDLLRVGGLSLFGSVTLPRLLEARACQAERPPGKARSVLMFNLLGGPSHMDMVDLKPGAPAEIRGEFRPIATSVPGIQICEHLPRLARWMHRATLIRTFAHTFNSHDPLAFLTGFTDNGFNDQAKPGDPPDVGAICQYVGLGPRDMPGAVCMPCYPGSGEGIHRRGPYGGFLGSRFDPLFTRCAPRFGREPTRNYYDPVPVIGEPLLPSLDLEPGLSSARLDERRSLLGGVDAVVRRWESSRAVDGLTHHQRRAFELLSAGKARTAFNLSREPEAVRERYGRNLYGQCLLAARRLVEAGVPFISVHQEIFGRYGHSYDMHENNFNMLKDHNLPILDQAIPTLLQDLEQRGLLDSTLVVVMGEMGRSPRINAQAGRDHWPQCGFSLLFGAGVKHGHVHGETDRHAAYPLSFPVAPNDFIATIYELLGIDPELTVPDRSGRPVHIAHGGGVIPQILA
jgi:hypothetical protein